jgi:hypothetical protein
MSSQRVVHNVAHKLEKCESLPCFASLSLNDSRVTEEALPQTQPIEAPKRDASGVVKMYTQQKHNQNIAEVENRNRTSSWTNFYDESVRPEKRKHKPYSDSWPPNVHNNKMVPHFLRSDEDPSKDWARLKGGCPDTMQLALGNAEMQKWIDDLKKPDDNDKHKEEKMEHYLALRDTYKLAKGDATPDNLQAFKKALHMRSVTNLPAPPGFLKYTYLRNLQVNSSPIPSDNKYFENKFFGPKWEDWKEATQNESQMCLMREANSTRDAWDKFLGIYDQDPNKIRKKKLNDQPQEQVPDNQPQQTPPSGENGEQRDDDDIVNGFWRGGAAEPQEEIPAEPQENVKVDEQDIFDLMESLNNA